MNARPSDPGPGPSYPAAAAGWPSTTTSALLAAAPTSAALSPSSAAASPAPPPDWWLRLAETDVAGRGLSQHRPARFLPPRSAQLDAARLDAELASLLGEQVARVLAPWDDASGAGPRLPGRAFLAAARPELSALVDALAFAATVGRGAPTPGMRMLNVRHADVRGRRSEWGGGDPSGALPGLSAGQRAAYGLLAVGGRYAAARLGRAALARSWAARGGDGGGGGGGSAAARNAASALAAADTALAVGGLLNMAAFLGGGVHRSLLERLVGAAAVPADPTAPRSLSFDYLNRTLVWHGVAELVLFVLPLVDPARVGRAVRAWLPRPAVEGGGGRGPSSGARPAGAHATPDPARPVCGWCGRADPPLPYAALPCTHVHCYWCLAQATAADPGAACPACGVRVVAMVRAVRRGVRSKGA